jgi:hypothetical protein
MENLYAVIALSHSLLRGFQPMYWMPISHMVKDAEGNYPGPQNAPEDSKVNLQHMNDYDYHNRFTRDKVLHAVQIIRDQEAEVRADIERVAECERQARPAKPKC